MRCSSGPHKFSPKSRISPREWDWSRDGPFLGRKWPTKKLMCLQLSGIAFGCWCGWVSHWKVTLYLFSWVRYAASLGADQVVLLWGVWRRHAGLFLRSRLRLLQLPRVSASQARGSGMLQGEQSCGVDLSWEMNHFVRILLLLIYFDGSIT